MDDCRKCQTATATPAEPGDLLWMLAAGPLLPAHRGMSRGKSRTGSRESYVRRIRAALADRAGAQGAPRSLRITFRRCDPPYSRSRELPQRPNMVCRLGRPKAHEAGLPQSQHRQLMQLRRPAPSSAYGYVWCIRKGALVSDPPNRNATRLPSVPPEVPRLIDADQVPSEDSRQTK